MSAAMPLSERRPCACGCGELAKLGRNYRPGHRPSTIADRLVRYSRINPATGCWEWTGASAHGYGHINIAGVTTGAHRVSYELHVGPIPEGLELDHLCRNPPCINPAHLEPVTHEENTKRSTAPTIALHLAGVCVNGHSLAEHASRRASTGAVVYCRACRRDRKASA